MTDQPPDGIPAATREDSAPVGAGRPGPAERPPDAAVRFYYPDEGFGNIYRRSMLNAFFTDLIRRTAIRTVAEVPVEAYGIVGAGSLIFSRLGVELTLVSEDEAVLERARALMRFNGVSGVTYLSAPLRRLPVPDDAFDFTWNFDELLPLDDREAVLRELCRVSKATMIVVPNAYSYGQVLHHLYHVAARTTCQHAGPRAWMRHAPIRAALARGGMEIVAEGMIDVPWWPSFPELPNLVRGWLGRPRVEVDPRGIPEAAPRVVPPAEEPLVRRKVARTAVIERGRWVPGPVKWLFAHNLYVLACKPAHRARLGL